MDYLDLGPSTQFSLISLILVVLVGFLIKVVIFFRRENTGVGPLYPNSWDMTQCRTLERFRMLIGLGLITLWAAYVVVIPSIQSKWPSGYLELISLVSMLSVSYAWAVLLAARNWSKFDAVPRSFLLIIAFLVLWWGTAFSAIGWMLMEASAPPRFRLIPLGSYANREIRILIRPRIYFFDNESHAATAAG